MEDSYNRTIGQPRKFKSDERGQLRVLLLLMNKWLLPSNIRTRDQIISETSAWWGNEKIPEKEWEQSRRKAMIIKNANWMNGWKDG